MADQIELSEETMLAAKVAGKLRASPALTSQREAIRETLDQFIEFLNVDETTAEAFCIYKTIIAIDGKSETAMSRAREALDAYIRKWSIAGAQNVEIVFK